jgi:catechol 2,3-dioxygenase-like lactoylglutathione lyase family enzyme
MFEKIQHIGYVVSDLDQAIDWFAKSFGATNAGGGPSRRGGRGAFLHFGKVEVELIEPSDTSALPKDALVMDHVGYVVSSIASSVEQLMGRGFKFAADSPNTNVIGQQVLYFDSSTTNGVKIHLTQLPDQPNTIGLGQGVEIEKIVHAGYLVNDLDKAIAWYVEKFDGTHIGGGPSRRGGRNAFVNFGQVQVELIESADAASMGPDHEMDHVGYVAQDIQGGIADCCGRGFQLAGDAPITNSVGQQVMYFDTNTSMGSRMHLTQLPS